MRIAYKHGFDYEILYENLDECLAFALEVMLIKQWGRADQKRGPLVNMTDGGEGTIGYVTKESSKEKMRGRHWIHNPVTFELLRPKKTESIPEGWVIGRGAPTEEALENMRIAQQKMAASKDYVNPMQGKIHHFETIEKNRKQQQNRIHIHNIETKEHRRISKNDPIPDGWARGTGKPKKLTIRIPEKYRAIRNSETGEVKRIKVSLKIPIGWVKSKENPILKGMIKIYNIVTLESTWHNPAASLPDGWSKGMKPISKMTANYIKYKDK
jgi:hypothetical protein